MAKARAKATAKARAKATAKATAKARSTDPRSPKEGERGAPAAEAIHITAM
jgi:hypothetical protein